MTDVPTRLNITLGILAGGRATRLGGLDKAWLQRNGTPQVLRWRDRFSAEVSATLVSANRDLLRYKAVGLVAVPDRQDRDDRDVGPLAGLSALADACSTRWLLTLPVDLVGVNECLVPTLIAQCGTDGAYACDDDGVQPLVALWRVEAIGRAIETALASGDVAVQSVQRGLDMACVKFPGVRFGNLNTPDDLLAAGVQSTDQSP